MRQATSSILTRSFTLGRGTAHEQQPPTLWPTPPPSSLSSSWHLHFYCNQYSLAHCPSALNIPPSQPPNVFLHPPPTSCSGTVIGFAACLGNIPIVEYLLEHDANVDAQDLGNISGKKLTHLGMVGACGSHHTVHGRCVVVIVTTACMQDASLPAGEGQLSAALLRPPRAIEDVLVPCHEA